MPTKASDLFGGSSPSTTANLRALLAVIPIVTKTASGTYALTDLGGLVQMNVASGNTLTIPRVSSVAWPVGSMLAGRQIGAGLTTVTAGTGVTLHAEGVVSTTSIPLAGQWAGFTAHHISSDVWVVEGNLA